MLISQGSAWRTAAAVQEVQASTGYQTWGVSLLPLVYACMCTGDGCFDNTLDRHPGPVNSSSGWIYHDCRAGSRGHLPQVMPSAGREATRCSVLMLCFEAAAAAL